MDAILAKMETRGILAPGRSGEVRRAMADGAPIEEALVGAGGLPEAEVLRYLGEEFGVPCVDPESLVVDPALIREFPAGLLLKHGLLPLEADGDSVLVASCRLFAPEGIDELRLATGRHLRPALAPAAEIARCLRQHLGVGADTVQSLVSDSVAAGIQVLDDSDQAVDLSAEAEDASIIRFVNQVLTEAIEARATDVHFEPFEDELRVRYRIDGVLKEAKVPGEVRRFRAAIVSRLKILSRLDIAEKRLPQDGRIKLTMGVREIDVRVSVIPMLHGEAVVLRLLDRSAALLGLDGLGMSPEDQDVLARICEMPHGIVLVTGPTGSGKTTTLYAALSRINDIARKIITIEDPIEYHLHGINQIQVATKAGLTFGTGLRSILRHDPDVILIGEIRDLETAEIAVQASLTGHLVFSTLHTNDAPGAATRLVDMGVEPYLVASSLEAVLAQRLVRVVCPECAAMGEPDPTEAALLRAELGDKAPTELRRGTGCRSCQGTGYRGRSGLFEMMPVDDSIRELILREASSREIRRQAVANGMQSLRRDGWRHLLAGKTTIEEVLRVTKDERVNGRPHSAQGTPDGQV
jgi:general secretion pathway protein E/type IV pilus assembly protein PilB